MLVPCRGLVYRAALAAGLLLGGCKKEKDPTPLEKLPPATTTGTNTWGCLVNGEAWTAGGADNMRADWTVSDGMSVSMYFSSRRVGLGFSDSTNTFSIPLGCQPIVRSGIYGAHANVRIRSDLYNASDVISGTACLTRLDRQAGVVSGTFAFTIVRQPGDTLRITDGRFDISNMDR